MFFIFFDKYTSFYEVTLLGFGVANVAFMVASQARNERDIEELKNDIEIFSKAAKAIDELLETTKEEREKWLELQDML